MKKITFLFCIILIFISLVSCKNIEEQGPSQSSTQTLQEENPPETSVLTTIKETTTQDTTVTSEITTTESTASSETSAISQTTAAVQQTTAAATQATTQATTTTAATTTATAPVTTAATTTAPPPIVPVINSNSYNALNYSEQKAMWISYLEFQNILKGKSQSQFKSSVQSMYNNCVAMGINTVYVHARSHSDAFYKSDLYPWSKNCTGTIGVSPGFDPFQILVDEAHARGLSIHAWINPMRGLTDSDIQNISSEYPIKKWYNDTNKRGTYIVLVNGTWYCSPAFKEVRDLITNGAKEIVSKYKVDGIHIDDYFYPTTATSFDSAIYAQSGSTNLSQWRLDTVSSMVKDLYNGIKSVNPTVLFGVSPQGNVNNNYATQYADVRKWCSNQGYLDYIVPQIYYGFKNTVQPYAANLQSWCDMVTAPNIKLVAGLAPYKIGTADNTGEWANDTRIIARQVETFRAQPKYGGAAFFRYESLFSPSASVAARINQERAELTAILK